jgi:large subunit ribosomal protein L15
MKLNQLAPNPGARKRKKRVGRGPGGTDKTAGRGHKGQQSRSGSSMAITMSYKSAGGQVPLLRRLPKRGFRNPNHQFFHLVNIADLERFEAGSVVNGKSLIEKGIIKKISLPIKLLGRGEVTAAYTIEVDVASGAAIAKVEAAGGSVSLKAERTVAAEGA